MWRVTAEGCGLLAFYVSNGCFKDRPMGAMRAGEEETWREAVFSEHLSGEKRLSYGVWWGLDTACTSPRWPDK